MHSTCIRVQTMSKRRCATGTGHGSDFELLPPPLLLRVSAQPALDDDDDQDVVCRTLRLSSTMG